MQPAMPEGTVYTCPMHPQVRRVGPGFCPICGMALEPLLPAKTDDDGAIRNVRRRFWVSIVLAVPVVLLAMVPHLFNLTLTHTLAHSLRIAELALTAPIVLWAAFDYYRRGWSRRHESDAEHVHADRPGRARRVRLQRLRDPRSGDVPARAAGRARHGRCVFRGRRGDRGAGAARRMARTRRTRAYQCGHSSTPGTGAEDRTTHPGRRHRGRSAAGLSAARRSCARAAGGKSAGGRSRDRRSIERR